jgi:hypothetical protein
VGCLCQATCWRSRADLKFSRPFSPSRGHCPPPCARYARRAGSLHVSQPAAGRPERDRAARCPHLHQAVREAVLPSGFVRIRHDGLLANRCKAYPLPFCRQALGHVEPPPQPEPKSVAQWMPQWTGSDITRCPACGHHPLERIPVPAVRGPNRNRDPPAPTSSGALEREPLDRPSRNSPLLVEPPTAIGDVRADALPVSESGTESAGSSLANVSATAESRGSQGTIPRSLEFLRPPRHHSIPIAHQRPHPRGSVQRIFSVIRQRLAGKHRVILPYDGKDALRCGPQTSSPRTSGR